MEEGALSGLDTRKVLYEATENKIALETFVANVWARLAPNTDIIG